MEGQQKTIKEEENEKIQKDVVSNIGIYTHAFL